MKLRDAVIRWATLCMAVAASALPPPAAAQSTVIYRCEHDGVSEFADRPCSVDGSVMHRQPQDVNLYSPVVARAADRGQHAPRATQHRGADRQTAQLLQCRVLQQQIDHMNALQRAGYHGRRGERLRDRWQQLKARYYDSKCLGVR